MLVSILLASLCGFQSASSVFEPFGIVPQKSSIDDAERKLGPGLKITGGHPHSGRAWILSPKSKWLLYVDGFDQVERLHDRSYMSFEVELQKYTGEWKKRGSVPAMRLTTSKGFWDENTLSLSESAVSRKLSDLHLSLHADGDQLLVTPGIGISEPHALIVFAHNKRIDHISFSIYAKQL